MVDFKITFLDRARNDDPTDVRERNLQGKAHQEALAASFAGAFNRYGNGTVDESVPGQVTVKGATSAAYEIAKIIPGVYAVQKI